MFEFTWVMILFFAASLLFRVGIVLLIIWGIIRLIDRYRTPIASATPIQATTQTESDK